ncbi:putative caffeine-induced death protein 2 [Rosellinia necatrix]|uniref:Putative caffeine-induced death protein 2 n=1 Tax=Rosellinia necatrix TaxID=77044 RepID=A0A1S7UI21_ROSNE|nr:putative caffeine-induced death protein 2 [Rosellinia necatrix]
MHITLDVPGPHRSVIKLPQRFERLAPSEPLPLSIEPPSFRIDITRIHWPIGIEILAYISWKSLFLSVTLAGLLWTRQPAPESTDATHVTRGSGRASRDIMTAPSNTPTLTPQFCFTPVALRDFLRISRGSIDDSIAQNLNALITPAKSGFDATSTSVRIARRSPGQIEPHSCQAFKDEVLFPSWQARSDVLTYCAYVATSPDPDDPEILLRAAETERNRERVVDERLDPYSGRYFPREPRTEKLALLLRQERSVERIVRSQTWSLVQKKCENSGSQDAEEALNQWRLRRERQGR